MPDWRFYWGCYWISDGCMSEAKTVRKWKSNSNESHRKQHAVLDLYLNLIVILNSLRLLTFYINTSFKTVHYFMYQCNEIGYFTVPHHNWWILRVCLNCYMIRDHRWVFKVPLPTVWIEIHISLTIRLINWMRGALNYGLGDKYVLFLKNLAVINDINGILLMQWKQLALKRHRHA